jgi:pilus assembly protein Flp/PilA
MVANVLNHVQGRARWLARLFLTDDSAATAIEYSLIAVVISVGIYAAVGSLGTTLLGTYQLIVNRMP